MVLDVNVLTTGWTIAGVIASLLVAMVALGLGVLSLMQTQRLQKRERKERLLNEIIDWAEDVAKTGIERSPSSILMMPSITSEHVSIYLDDVLGGYLKLTGRSRYIGEIVLGFDQGLQGSVAGLIKSMDEQIGILRECKSVLGNHEKVMGVADKLGESNPLLHEASNKVINEAVKIKTRGMS